MLCGSVLLIRFASPHLSSPPLESFTAVYPGGIWNVQIATLEGDDPQDVDIEKAAALCRRSVRTMPGRGAEDNFF